MSARTRLKLSTTCAKATGSEDVLRNRDFDALLEQFYSWHILKARERAAIAWSQESRSEAARPVSWQAHPFNHREWHEQRYDIELPTSEIGTVLSNGMIAGANQDALSETREFSKRYGFRTRPVDMVREQAPEALRSFVLFHLSSIARRDIHLVRDVVSHTARYIPNPANQTVAEIWNEVQSGVRTCEWFLVYDLIEEIYRALQWSNDRQDAFVTEMNEFFREHNIGWQLRAIPVAGIHLLAPEIVIRGSEAFEIPVSAAMQALETSRRSAAQTELREALQDLSRRPVPDLTGAVHHAMAALECVAADVCGETGETLGQIVKRHPDRFPAPLGDAVSKMYGFASDRARHVKEGKALLQKEAEFIVAIAAALTTFLLV